MISFKLAQKTSYSFLTLWHPMPVDPSQGFSRLHPRLTPGSTDQNAIGEQKILDGAALGEELRVGNNLNTG